MRRTGLARAMIDWKSLTEAVYALRPRALVMRAVSPRAIDEQDFASVYNRDKDDGVGYERLR